MAARRSRRRKGGAARRKSRRAARSVARSNPPRHAKRRRSAHAKRRGFRRNPGGDAAPKRKRTIVGGLLEAFVDGISVTGGVVVQNNVVRLVPDLVPATMASAPMLNGLLKDVGGIIGGAFLFHRFLGGDRARFVVAGQAHAAIARVLRGTNIPVLSTSLGEYDPMRGVGTYTPGTLNRAAPARLALPAPRPNNVATLKGVGIYTDGMSQAPSMY